MNIITKFPPTDKFHGVCEICTNESDDISIYSNHTFGGPLMIIHNVCLSCAKEALETFGKEGAETQMDYLI
jgi:hypothetical protein